MVCQVVKVGDVTAIVCGPRRRVKRCACGQVGDLLCDWKVGGGKTCDRPICKDHAQEVGPDKHLCQTHQIAYQEWLARRQATVP